MYEQTLEALERWSSKIRIDGAWYWWHNIYSGWQDQKTTNEEREQKRGQIHLSTPSQLHTPSVDWIIRFTSSLSRFYWIDLCKSMFSQKNERWKCTWTCSIDSLFICSKGNLRSIYWMNTRESNGSEPPSRSTSSLCSLRLITSRLFPARQQHLLINHSSIITVSSRYFPLNLQLTSFFLHLH